MVRIPTHRQPTHPGKMLLEEFLNVTEENINYKITDSHELVYFLTAINQAITDIDNLDARRKVLLLVLAQQS